jgi:hypothetical protein
MSVVVGVGTIQSRLAVFDVATGVALPSAVPLQVYPGTVQAGRSRFTPDGGAVAYLHPREDGLAPLLRRPLSAWQGGAGRTDTLFAGSTETIESFGFSPDGRRAVVSIVDWLSSLTIAEGIQGIVPPRRPR